MLSPPRFSGGGPFRVRYLSFELIHCCAFNQLRCFLLVFFLCVSPLFAQEEAVDTQQPVTEQIEPGESGAAEPATRQEQMERSADIREAIHENLDLKGVAELSDEPEETPPEPWPEQIHEEELPSGEEQLSPQAEAPPVEEEELWYDRFTPFFDRIRQVPVLSDRGWLHFGRAEFEYGHFFSSDLLSGDSGFNFRSLRGGLIKMFDSGRSVKLELDLTDGDSNFTDLYVRFPTKLGLFTLGNQKVAQSLVNQTSRLARTFMEEPLPAEAFGLIRRLGVGWDFHRRKVGVHLTAFGQDLNDGIGDFGYGARMYTNPTRTRFSVAHVGVSAVQESMDRDARARARPESRVTDTFLVDTGTDADVETLSIFGLETAFAHKNWSVRGEYMYTEWDRKTNQDTSFSGYYLQANWVLTGESFQYQQGKFTGIRPNSSRGAWEVALRHSYVDLNDQDVLGGTERNTTLALNWYGPGNQLRVQSNLIYAKADTLTGKEDPLIFQVRVQVHW